MRRTSLRRLLLISLAIAAMSGGWMYRQHQRYKHLTVHEPGMMYRSAWLEPDVMSDVIEKYQIRTVVNLCNPGEMGLQRWAEERAAVTNAGATLIELPMPTTIDADDSLIAVHVEHMSDPNHYPMLVPCQHGVTRTAKFLAIYDIVFREMTGPESLASQPLFGRDEHNVNVRAFVKNFEAAHARRPSNAVQRLKILR